MRNKTPDDLKRLDAVNSDYKEFDSTQNIKEIQVSRNHFTGTAFHIFCIYFLPSDPVTN